MHISLPKNLKEFVKERTLQAHYGTPSDYIRGLIREDLKRLEQERLEQELVKGLRSGKGIRMTKQAFKQLKAEAAKRIHLTAASMYSPSYGNHHDFKKGISGTEACTARAGAACHTGGISRAAAPRAHAPSPGLRVAHARGAVVRLLG